MMKPSNSSTALRVNYSALRLQMPAFVRCISVAAKLATGLVAIACIALATGCFEENPFPGGLCTTNSDCGSGQECFGVDAETGEGQCRAAGTECTVDSHCATDEFCDEGLCLVRTSADWPYVAIVSAATASDDLDNTNTPGPDIDAIELIAAGESTFATTVEVFSQGAGGLDGVDNVNDLVSALTGPNDAIPTGGGNCSLAEGTGFWSMGDPTGFAIVSFGGGVGLLDGDIITVWELDDLICDNISTVRSDVYEVLTGTRDVDVLSITSVSQISGDNWLYQGASTGSGGLQEFTADIP